MILKGNQRGGGQQLAAHLMNSFDNERVEIAEVRGTVAQDLSGAFAEITATARIRTKLRKEFYSLSLSPDPRQKNLTREQYLDLIARTERSLKLVGQPRAVVFHTKDGREHCHAVWSRADMERKKGIEISHDRLKLRAVARHFCRDHGLEIPEGMKLGKRARKFNEKTKENLGERQQKERSGISKLQRMADIATCWKETAGGSAFVQALEKKGYFLARGDQRAFVVVDLHGEVHSLSRQLSGIAKSKELRDRMAGYPLDELPDISAAKEWAQQQRRQYDNQQHNSEVEKRVEALKAHQQKRRDEIDRARLDLFTRHLTEREGLRAAHEADIKGVTTVRLNKQPKGLLALLTRITGVQIIIEKRQQKQDAVRESEHKRHAQALALRHARELHDIDRRSRALTRLETRENKSVDTASQREIFQKILKHVADRKAELKPEFDRAAYGEQRTATGGGKSLTADFNKAPKPPIDLVKEFNREVENRLSRDDGGREPDGPEPHRRR